MRLPIEYVLLGICLSSVEAEDRSKTDVNANSFGRNTAPPDVSRSPANGRAEPDAVQKLQDVAEKWNTWRPKINRMTLVSDGNITKKKTRNDRVFSFEGPRARREAESESKEKKQVAAAANDEKRSDVEEKKAEEKEKTKERAKAEEIKEAKEDEEEEEVKRDMKMEEAAGNENLGKAKKRHYSVAFDEEDGEQKTKRNNFRRSNSNSKISPVADRYWNFKQKRNDDEKAIEDEEEEELENLLRQRKHQLRQARDREDKRIVQRKKTEKSRLETHQRRRRQHSAPQRRYRNADDSSSYRQLRRYNPFLHSEEELQSRTNRDVALGEDDSNLLRRRRDDRRVRSRRRRFNEGFEFANDKENHHLVDAGEGRYEDRMVRRARDSDDDGGVEFYYDAVRKARGLGDEDDEEEEEEEEEEDNERKARSSDDEEHDKRASNDDDDANIVTYNDAVYKESRVKRDSTVDGNEGRQEANRQKRLMENEHFGGVYEDIDPKKMLNIGRGGKKQLGKPQPAEKLSN